MADYTYKDRDGDLLRFESAHDGAIYLRAESQIGQIVFVHVAANDRQAVAQALAGDEYHVVLASPVDDEFIAVEREEYERLKRAASIPDWERELLAGAAAQEEIDQLKRDYDKLEKLLKAAQPDRPEPVDPASVRVGDVVEIEADDGSWMVRARVSDTDDPSHDGPPYPQDSPFGIKLDRFYWWPKIADATVRVLRPAEPEPEPAAVEALAQLLAQVDGDLNLHNVIAPNAYALELIRRGVTVRVVNTDA